MISWHSLTTEEVFKKLATSEDGLSMEEAKKRLKKFGHNKFPREKSAGGFTIFFRQFKSPLIYLLVVAGAVSFFLHDAINGFIIFSAVAISALFGYFQEQKSQKSLASLTKMIAYTARVIRQGEEKKIDSEHLVPGDWILLAEGDKIPADIRLFNGDNFETQESVLTGESMPVKKIHTPLDVGVQVQDQFNIAFMGTIVSRGRAVGIVVETGTRTEFGRIATSLTGIKDTLTPFQKKIEQLVKWVTIGIMALVSVIFVTGLVRGIVFQEIFTVSVAVAVAAIPESLVVAITAILTIGMMRLARHKALVRKLIAAETLGGTTVICADKTGTLTEGIMRVSEIWSDSENFALEIAMLASEAYVENLREDASRWNIHGDPMEKAIMKAGIERGLKDIIIKKDEFILDEMPFESQNQFMAVILRPSFATGYGVALQGFRGQALLSNHRIIYYKGSPEKILSASVYIYDSTAQGRRIRLYAVHFGKLKKVYEDFSRKGLRVLAIGYRETESEKFSQIDNMLSEITFVGFIVLNDPVRLSVKDTIKEAQRAGIKVVMITGDHKYTASSIAKEVGLVDHHRIIDGNELAQMDDQTLKKEIKNISVFARILPHDKLRIVNAYQTNGEVVAMTGDGVNDAPALKKADIGIAVGSGTDVAKEVAEMVILDNNFKTIVHAVEQGRVIFDNIRKVATFLLSDSFTEVILIGGSMMFGLPLPVVAAQILWVNLVEDGLPALALAYEPKEKDVMKLPPRGKGVPLLDGQMKAIMFIIGIVSGLTLLGLFLGIFAKTGNLEYARTMVFAALGSNSLLYIFSIKNLRSSIFRTNILNNIYLVGAVIFGFFMILIAIYASFLQKILHTIPLSVNDWLIIAALGVLEIIGIETTKKVFRVKTNG